MCVSKMVNENKIAILMTYYNRPYQIMKTFDSICKTKHSCYDIYVVDDASDVPLRNAVNLELYRKKFNKGTKLYVMEISKGEKTWNNPVIIYNKGLLEILKSDAGKIVLQNAECIHYGDVLTYADENTNETNYISFGCFSLDEKETFDENSNDDVRRGIMESCKNGTNRNCDISWYNHPVYRPVAYDFCNCITRSNIIKLNGYDERFANLIAYGDVDLIMRVGRLGLNTKITTLPEPIVIHQYHEHSYYPDNSGELIHKSVLQYTYNYENEKDNYKAQHTVMEELK